MMIQFFVQGDAKPAGSKRGFALKKGGQFTGRVAMADDSGAAGKRWRDDVKAIARKVRRKTGIFHEGPIQITATFYRARPQHHFGKRGGQPYLKENAPKHPTGKPDATKLLRAVEDAITGILWKDDAQIVVQMVRKKYCNEVRPQPGVWIKIEPLE